MPLTEAQVLLPAGAQQTAGNMFAPATAMLSSALNSAVESGRRMVDLQSHQEDLFMTEREKLRLASERKGLEARRMFETDRGFNEQVRQSDRGFYENVRQSDRDYLLKSEGQTANISQGWAGLGLKGQELALQRELGVGGLEIQRQNSEAQLSHYRAQEARDILRGKKEDLALDLTQRAYDRQISADNFLKEQLGQANQNAIPGGSFNPLLPGSGQQDAGPIGNLLGNAVSGIKNFLHIGPDPAAAAQLDEMNPDVQYVRQLAKNYSLQDIAQVWDKLDPKHKEIARKIKWTSAGKGGAAPPPNKTDVPNLGVGFDPVTGKASGKTVAQPQSQYSFPQDPSRVRMEAELDEKIRKGRLGDSARLPGQVPMIDIPPMGSQ